MSPQYINIPIFPLPEVVFFPGTLLPLHIFEPRYKRMISDLVQNGQLLGIVQLRPGWDKDYYGAPPVYKVLGVGELVEHRRYDDGRFDILLEGKFRGLIRSESLQNDYRVAETEMMEDIWPSDETETVTSNHHRLMSVFQKLESTLPDTVTLPRLKTAEPPTAGELTDILASVFVEDAYDKQCLLSETNVARRQRLLEVQLNTLFHGI
jgi:uncharacterized protein